MPSASTRTGVAGTAGGRAGSASAQPAVEQQRRVDALRELADLIDRLLGVAAESSSSTARASAGSESTRLGGEPQVHDEPHQLLLRAVVEVALDPPPLGVRGG